jgi:hypothetical protein
LALGWRIPKQEADQAREAIPPSGAGDSKTATETNIPPPKNISAEREISDTPSRCPEPAPLLPAIKHNEKLPP